jgi:hypothetical protein
MPARKGPLAVLLAINKEVGFPGKLGCNSRRHFDFLFSSCHRDPASQPWTLAIKSSNGVLSPQFDCRQEPFGHHAEGLFCFNSSVPASSPGVAPGSKSCRLGQGILRPTLQLLAAVGSLAVQTVIDEPLAGRLLSAQSGWRITSYTPRAASTGISSEARKGRI